MRALLIAPSFFIAAVLAAPSWAEATEAPFGLEWGMQVGDLTALDIAIQSTTKSGNLAVVTVTETPEALDDTYLVTLWFDNELGLVNVRWTSNKIEADTSGERGRRKYTETRRFIVENYGEPTDEALVIGARLFDQDDEFYQCLAYEGCGVWSAIWEQEPAGGILLSIEGMDPGTGFVQLYFESEGWTAVNEQ
jgi:hypothetical protein